MLAIIVNGYYKSKSSEHQLARLIEECQKKGLEHKVVTNNKPNLLDKKGIGFSKAIYLDKDLSFAYLLESKGVRLYNSSRAVALSDNKASTLIALRDKIKIPKTVFSPKIYRGSMPSEFLDSLEKIIEYPIVIKESVGSLGEQVYLASSREELSLITQNIGTREHIYQDLIKDSYGRSLRIYVVGGKVMGGVLLENPKDFRSNSASGGISKGLANIPPIHQKAALNIANYLGLDFCGIDMFDLEEPVLIEVNSNAYFVEMEKYGINIAEAIVELTT